MTEFKLKLETVQDGKSCINLFDKVEIAKKENSSRFSSMLSKLKLINSVDVDMEGFEVVEPFTEYLLYLDGDKEIDEQIDNKKAEIIVVVDKSGSMSGTPWSQVQSALIKMLDITRDVSNCRAISYNQCAEEIRLSGNRETDKSKIKSIRSGGSTNFVAVFQELQKIFKDKEEDPTKPFYIFLMTDGHDTCNSPSEITTAKEHLQAEIERFGGEVIFNVLGFSDDHDENFLESLALIGTSDGFYSFVQPSEGQKALEERLVALVESTSSTIGRSINIEAISESVEFLGNWFGESEKEVVLPAKMTKNEKTIAISTRKFVRIRNGEEPKITLRIHEKLRGDARPLDASILSVEKIELTDKDDIDSHNLKKLRSAMNLITSRMGESEDPEDQAFAKFGYELIKKRMNDMNGLNTSNSEIKRHHDTVKSLIQKCEYVFEPKAEVSEVARLKMSRGMRSVQTYDMGQHQNMSVQSSRSTKRKGHARSTLQMKSRQTDYSRYSDSE